MPKSASYWAFARECEHWAKSVIDERDRIVFFEMAKAWAELALKEQSAFRVAPVLPAGQQRFFSGPATNLG